MSDTLGTVVYQIPLSPQPQNFTIVLAGVTYNVLLRWNTFSLCWVLDFSDVNGNPLVQGIPMVPGVDLFGQYAYLNFGGSLYCQVTGDTTGASPSFSNLGSTGNLYWVPDA